ncbi:MAG: SRPBCC family protein [Chitinophagaceae bacterium]
MRVIKLGIISLIFFSLVLTGISLFFPSHVRISKAIDINSSKDTVLLQLKDPANWKKWYPGADTMELYMEEGKVRGLRPDSLQGVMSITGSSDSSVTAITSGPGVRETVTGWNLYPSPSPHTVTIQWYMDFHLRWYPWEKFSSLLLEKRYGPLMEKGLSNLKALLEK